MKNNLAKIIVVAIVVGLLGFYCGMQYQKSQRGNFSIGMRNFNGTEQQQSATTRQRNGMGGFVNGEIMSISNNTITIKTKDGGSKVVIYSDSTKVNKTSEGSKSDLKVGETITAMGSTSSDGAVTAQSISLGNAVFQGMPAGGQPGQQDGQQPPTEAQK
jgi:hypothetical protein